MGKLIRSSTLIFLGYAIVVKIASVVFHTIRYIWGIETSLYNPVETVSISMQQMYIDTIMSSLGDIMMFIGGALFIFLVVNLLVEAKKRKA